MPRLAAIVTHAIQYYSPLFRELSKSVDLEVIYGHSATERDQAEAGFGVTFDWDLDLSAGIKSRTLTNVSKRPGLRHFSGVDAPEVYSVLKTGNFDAVLIFGWYRKYLLQALLSAKRLGLPVIVRGDSQLDTHRSRLKRLCKDLLFPHFLRQFDGAAIVGQKNRDYFNYYSYPSERQFYSPHCIDDQWFADRATDDARTQLRAQIGVRKAEFLVLFAGKLVEFKRPTDLVHAVGRLRNQGENISLLVAGSGELEETLRATSELHGIDTHFLGFCNQTKMPSVYAAADLLVLPSTGRETWGLVVNEALACGTPVVVSDSVGCAPEVEELLGSKAIFPIGNVETLAARIRDSMQHRPNRSALKVAGETFSLAAAAEGIVRAVRHAARA